MDVTAKLDLVVRGSREQLQGHVESRRRIVHGLQIAVMH